MKRATLLPALLALLLWEGAAQADVTARYALSAGGPPAIAVEANDRGDSRIGDGRGVALVTRDGVSYVVVDGPGGAFAARQDMLDEYARQHPDAVRGTPLFWPRLQGGLTGYRASEVGTETHGGRSGTAWRLHPGQPPGPPHDVPFVVSTDPELAPVGAALARQFEPMDNGTSLAVGYAIRGRVPPAMLEIIRGGTILRAENLLYLHSVSTDPVPASAFSVPELILDPEQFLVRLAWR